MRDSTVLRNATGCNWVSFDPMPFCDNVVLLWATVQFNTF